NERASPRRSRRGRSIAPLDQPSNRWIARNCTHRSLTEMEIVVADRPAGTGDYPTLVFANGATVLDGLLRTALDILTASATATRVDPELTQPSRLRSGLD